MMSFNFQALLLLSLLPDSWKTLMASLNNSTPNGVLTLILGNDCMLNEELKHKEQGD
jgi:hypothetical protein